MPEIGKQKNGISKCKKREGFKKGEIYGIGCGQKGTQEENLSFV